MTLKVYKYRHCGSVFHSWCTFDEDLDEAVSLIKSYEVTEQDLNEAVLEAQTREGLAELLWERAKFKEDIAELRARVEK